MQESSPVASHVTGVGNVFHIFYCILRIFGTFFFKHFQTFLGIFSLFFVNIFLDFNSRTFFGFLTHFFVIYPIFRISWPFFCNFLRFF